MLNLLPSEARAEIRKEYRFRLGIVALNFFVAALIMGVIVALPYTATLATTYFESKAKAAVTHTVTEEDRKTMSEFQNFKELLALLDPKATSTEPTLIADIVRTIVAEKPANVALESFFVSTEAVRKTIAISGTAKTRENLVEFSKNLSRNELFSRVDLPVSNLSKKTDVDFTINLTVGEK